MNYFDCHADTLTEIKSPEETLDENNGNLDLQRAGDFVEKYTQIFAVWKDAGTMADPLNPEKEFLRAYHLAVAYLQEENRKMTWCLNSDDMEKAHRQRKGAAFLAVEDVSIMGEYADKAYEMGFRFAMLTWNYRNRYGCGAVEDQCSGLTEEGKQLACNLLKQGMILDISHLSDRGAFDLLNLTDRPVIASHSDIREVWDHQRNLPDELARELIRRKGLIGMNFYGPFVGLNPSMEDILKHMDRVLELGGEDSLAIGSDFDGCHDQFPEGIKGIQSVPALKEYLLQHGFDEKLTEKIFFDNAYNFVMKNL